MMMNTYLPRQKTPSTGTSNTSSRNATPTPRPASSVLIPERAQELLHKKYERPKSKIEMAKLQLAVSKLEKMKQKKQEDDARSAWLSTNSKGHHNNNNLQMSAYEMEQENERRRILREKEEKEQEDRKNTLHLSAAELFRLEDHDDDTDNEEGTNRKDRGNNKKNKNNNNMNSFLQQQQIPGTAIQRLSFKNMSEILINNTSADDPSSAGNDRFSSNNNPHASSSSSAADLKYDPEEFLQGTNFSTIDAYHEALAKKRRTKNADGSPRSHVHRTWTAIDAEQAHERRSRAVKRAFSTAQTTPSVHGRQLQNNNNNNNTQKRIPKRIVNEFGQESEENLVSNDDEDDDPTHNYNNDSFGYKFQSQKGDNTNLQDSSTLALSPFSSKILRFEMEHATVNGKNNGGKRNIFDDTELRTNGATTIRRYRTAIDAEYPQQQYLEERARATFMSEVMKRRELENLPDDSQYNAKEKQDEDNSRNKKAAAIVDARGNQVPDHMKLDRYGNMILKKYKLKSLGKSKNSNHVPVAGRVGVRAGEDIVGYLSPVGVMARALGLGGHHMDDDNDMIIEEDASDDDVYTTDDDDDDFDCADEFARYKRNQLKNNFLAPNEEDDENQHVDDAGKKLWTFDPRIIPTKDNSGLLLEEMMDDGDADANHNMVKSKVRLASLFNREIPNELVEEARLPPPSQRINHIAQPEMDEDEEEMPDDFNNLGGGTKGTMKHLGGIEKRKHGGDTNFDTKKRRRNVNDILNGISLADGDFDSNINYINGGQDGDGQELGSTTLGRGSAGWRGRGAMNISAISGVARELALKYWNMRMNYVDADAKVFHDQEDVRKVQKEKERKQEQERTRMNQQNQERSEEKQYGYNHQVPSLSSSQPSGSSKQGSAILLKNNNNYSATSRQDQLPSSFEGAFTRNQARTSQQQDGIMKKVTAYSVSTTNGLSSLQQIIEARKSAEERMSHQAKSSRNNSPSKNNNNTNATRFVPSFSK